MVGFCHIIQESISKIKELIFDHLVSLVNDVQDFSREIAKASHVVLLCRIEQGEIQNKFQMKTKMTKQGGQMSRHIPHTSQYQTIKNFYRKFFF